MIHRIDLTHAQHVAALGLEKATHVAVKDWSGVAGSADKKS